MAMATSTPTAGCRRRISLAALRPLRTPRRSAVSGVFLLISPPVQPVTAVLREGLVVAPPVRAERGEMHAA